MGRIHKVRVQPWESGVVSLECTIVDATGGIDVIFLGRRQIPGIRVGKYLEVEGMVIECREALAIMNPEYTLIPSQG